MILLKDQQIWLQGSWAELAHSGDAFLSLVKAWEEEEEAEAEEAEAQEAATAKAGNHITSHGHGGVLGIHLGHQVSLRECQDALTSVLAAFDGRRIDPMLIQRVRQAMSGEAEIQMDLIRDGAISWPDFKAGRKFMKFRHWAVVWYAVWRRSGTYSGTYSSFSRCFHGSMGWDMMGCYKKNIMKHVSNFI